MSLLIVDADQIDGVLSPANVPLATSTDAGAVLPDGVTITLNPVTGEISSTGGGGGGGSLVNYNGGTASTSSAAYPLKLNMGGAG